MKTSQTGIDLIKKYEGCKLTAYKCPAGVWTIGYGTTKGVKQGMTISQADAEALLKADLERFESNVMKYNSTYNWTQNEFDALVSFAYNIGSIDQLTAHGSRSKDIIASKIPAYCKVNGSTLAGLLRRRVDEQNLFLASGNSTEQKCPQTDDKGIVEYSFAKDSNVAISSNFKVKEFRCKDNSDKIIIDVDFVKDKLQSIRNHFGKPVVINSAYRTPAYNKKVGGASKSYHMQGRAFDIVINGIPLDDICKYAESIGVKGIIRYNTFVHVDSRDTKYYARNKSGAITVVSTFK